MTVEMFRRAALALHGTMESAHRSHPDFRAGGKIFATLGYPDAAWGMVHVTLQEQAKLIELDPDTYISKGAWGKKGCTLVRLAAAKTEVVGPALERAWELAQQRPTRGAGMRRRRSAQ